MKTKLSQNITYWLGVVAIGLVVGVSLQFVRAWTEPSIAPPGGNVGAPINTSNLPQQKIAGLAINAGEDTNGDTFIDTWNAIGLLVPYGNVGIGTTTPGYKLDVAGTNTTGIRYVKSGSKDARITVGDPTKTWSIASGWSTAGDFSVIEEGVAGDRLYIKQGGNVGIGTANPTEKFQVCIGISCASVKEDITIANYGYDIYGPWVYPGGSCSNVYPQETCDPAIGGFASYTCDVNTNKNCVDTLANVYEGGKCPSGTGCCKRNIDCKIEGKKVIKWVDSPSGAASVITD